MTVIQAIQFLQEIYDQHGDMPIYEYYEDEVSLSLNIEEKIKSDGQRTIEKYITLS